MVTSNQNLASLSHGRRKFASLGEAVQSSLPGDTIALEGSHVVKNIIILWPLVIQSISKEANRAHLECEQGADTALDVRASTWVLNVSIRACSSGCILHRSGHLRVENCFLHCVPRGLDHLFSALVTVASDFGKHMEKQNSSTKKGGVLTVVNTQIKGGSQAVHCRGTGALQSVRVICRSHSSKFWFDVDSRHPGRSWYSVLNPQAQSIEFKRDLVIDRNGEEHAKRKRIE